MNEVKFLGLVHSFVTVSLSNVKKKFTPNPLKKGMNARIDIIFFHCCKGSPT